MDEQSENISDQENQNIAGEGMESLGAPQQSSEEGTKGEELPQYAKERLGRQQKRHDREMRDMRQQMQMMQSQLQSPSQMDNNSQQMSQPEQSGGGGVDDQIQKAVSYALNLQKMEKQKADEAEKAAHVHKQYQNLQDHLDKASDKYDDFDEVVRGNDTPFTPAMRDAALLIDNPGDVLYKLGKNRDELARISKLHPIDQAREINKLSFALMGGNDKGVSQPRTIGQVKSNPVPTRDVTDNTSVGELRRRMKAGWK
jgi:hypothetical protein